MNRKNMNIFIISEEYDLLYIKSWFWLLSFRSEMTSGVDLKTQRDRHPRGECYKSCMNDRYTMYLPCLWHY